MRVSVRMGYVMDFFFSSRRRHTRCALVTGVQTCALPIYGAGPYSRHFPNRCASARAHATLRRRGAAVRPAFLAGKYIFELDHARIGKEQGRVVRSKSVV